MSRIERQLLQSQQRMTALSDAAAGAAPRDEPIQRPADMRQGVGWIVSNDGDGAYRITELWWDPSDGSWTDAVAPLGLVSAAAVDWMSRDGGSVGQRVRFHESRAQQGQAVLLIDAGGSSEAVTRYSSFCVHYSGTNSTDAVFSLPGCRHSLVQTILAARECSGHDPGAEHPAFTGQALWRSSSGWFDALDTWTGGDWQDLWYQAYDKNGAYLGIGDSPLTGLYLQGQVAAGGEFRLRVDREPYDLVSCVIHGVVCVVSMPPPPGQAEIGNCCCHDDDWGTP